MSTRVMRRWTRIAGAVTCSLALLGCGPERIGVEGESSESSAGESGLDAGTPDLGESDSDDPDSGDDGWGPSCKGGEGPLSFLDLCPPDDPCELSNCDTCLGGLCVDPIPAAACEGVTLAETGVSVPEASHAAWVEVDGLPGDELVGVSTGVQGRVEVLIEGALVISEVLPDRPSFGFVPMRYDADGLVDLVVDVYVDPNDAGDSLAVVLGDGEGGFAAAPTPVPDLDLRSPVPLDYDLDGAEDLLAWYGGAGQGVAYRNLGGTFELGFVLPEFSGNSTPADVDGDGITDVLVGRYPSPDLLLGDGAGLNLGPALPSPERGPWLEYGIARPLAADLDGDGIVEVIAVIADNHGRGGLRIWRGLGAGQFEAPRDQMLAQDWLGDGFELAGAADLDGVAPAELVVVLGRELVYVRPDLAGPRPLACMTTLIDDVDDAPPIGDIDADGWPELAIQSLGRRVYTTLP